MRNYLLSIDPGLATGLAFLDITDPLNPKKVWTKEVDVIEFYDTVPDCITEFKDNLTVVCENFIITVQTAKKTQSPWSLQLIGIVQYFCYMNDVELHLPNPSVREFTSHDMLKKFDLWHTGGAGHAMQALRHAFAYLAQKNKGLAKSVIDLV